MELEIRTKEGILIVKLVGEMALGYYSVLLTDKGFFKGTKNIVNTGIITVFISKTDVKITLWKELEIWILEGYYIKINV